ncbi:MAG: sn-glycerol-3-phosphate ABC transporter ATP-binding protein UgpC [Deltaproteobacteria bacterium]|nr:sn-glycerol-3-phosphate ABC transporter ATP-binding protein UgpC [Deltaproteobacteria bacterium]
MAAISLRGIEKRYGDVVIVKTLDLEIADGEFVVLVGPSGCGKSTTLRMIAGLETISAGELAIDGKRVNDVSPGDRDLAMVFQSYALYPHMSVRENIAFGLLVRKVDKAEIAKRVDDAAEMLKLTGLLHRKPKDLSGGQRQRVAMARAVVRRPKAFLFDEPLSNLDAKLRMEVRAEIAALRRRFATTTVYVTHDQVEAMTLADRVVVLNDGIAQQVGSPLDVYRRPANRFVATFLGTPTMNVVEKALIKAPAPAAALHVGVRPHDVQAKKETAGALLTMKVEHIERLGQESFVFGHVGPDRFGAVVDEDAMGVLAHGSEVGLFARPDRLSFFDDKGLRIEA